MIIVPIMLLITIRSQEKRLKDILHREHLMNQHGRGASHGVFMDLL